MNIFFWDLINIVIFTEITPIRKPIKNTEEVNIVIYDADDYSTKYIYILYINNT